MKGMQRIRLAEWARREGVARITAYRMLRNGVLPVPSECSPTGRWYVYVPVASPSGTVVLYAYADLGDAQSHIINEQLRTLTDWASRNQMHDFTAVREVGRPHAAHRPKLASLLADASVRAIVITDPTVIGSSRHSVLVAALAAQQRSIVSVAQDIPRSVLRRRAAIDRIAELSRDIWGARRGDEFVARLVADGPTT